MLIVLSLELPAGEPRLKASAYVAEVSATWNKMTAEEKTNATINGMEGLKEHRENKAFGGHSVPINAYQDSRATLDTLQNEVSTVQYHILVVIHLIYTKS
jgi:hypothetical protein